MQYFIPVVLSGILTLCACSTTPVSTDTSQTSLEQILTRVHIVDLTHVFSDKTIYWVTAREFELEVVARGETDKGYYYAANNFSCAEHGGTHIDAPIHFAAGGQTVDEIPLEKLIGPAVKIDVSAQALADRDYLVSIEDFVAWEQREGMEIPEGCIVLLETGYSKYYPDKIQYLGTDQRGPEAVTQLHFPGLSPDAAEWLVQRKIHAVGIDTPSIDYGQSQYFKSHVILLKQNIPAFENLANLDRLPSKGFTIIGLPIKIEGGSGGPSRVIALLNKDI